MSYNLEELQIFQTKMLIELVSIFEENKIDYFLYAGTLLGAVRHKGHIPWDDDIDLCMIGDDFDRLVSMWENILPDKYLLETKIINQETNTYFIKIIDKETTVIENALKDIKTGVSIDIFPLDVIRNDYRTIKRVSKLKRMIALEKTYTGLYYKNNLKTKIFKLLSPIIKFIYSEKKLRYNIMNLRYKIRFTKGDYLVSTFGDRTQKVIFKKDLFETYVLTTFNGYKLKIPNGYSEILEQLYGDFMEEPKSKLPKHNYKYINLEKPFID